MKQTTIRILKESGWYPKRKIDIKDLTKLYEKKEFEIFPKAKKFLEEYGMLNVYSNINPKIPESDIVKYKFSRNTLNTTNMIPALESMLSRDYVREYEEEYVEEKLVVVGSLGGHESLMISESGRLFTENGFVGNNAEEFWDRILNYGVVTSWLEWNCN